MIGADARAPAAGAADEQQRPAGPNPAGGVTGDLERQPEVRLDVAARLVEVHLGERRVVGPAAR